MSSQQSKWPTIISLTVGAISIGLGVLNWKLQNVENYGWYTLLFSLSIASLIIPSIYFYFERTDQIEKSIQAMLNSVEIDSVPDKKDLIKKQIAACHEVCIYGEADLLEKIDQYLGVSNSIETKCNFTSYLPPKQQSKWTNTEYEATIYPFAVQAMFFVNKGDVVVGALLIPGKQSDPATWIYMANERITNRLRSAFEETYSKNAVEYNNSFSKWFTDKTIMEFSREYSSEWLSYTLQHRLLVRYGRKVTAIQKEISDKAINVDALDMSDPTIWLTGGRAEKVSQANKELIKNKGTVRRIFLVQAKAWLESNPDYKKNLIAVLKEQKEFGVDYGVVFEDKIVASHARDLAVYELNGGEKICWIETTPHGGSADGSEGYFSSRKEDINQCERTIAKIWSEHNPRTNADNLLT
jgi:hypothetical protein